MQSQQQLQCLVRSKCIAVPLDTEAHLISAWSGLASTTRLLATAGCAASWRVDCRNTCS